MLPCRRSSWVVAVCGLSLWGSVSADAQFILRETFETDGDGTRYNFVNKGAEIGADGPFVWGRDSDATRIGLATEAPKKRAAILWSSAAFTGDFTDDAFMMFDSVVSWATDNQANARVGFFPGPVGQGAIDLRDRLVAAGHTVTDIPDVASLPAADQLDLLIHSEEAAPAPPTAFISYDVPVIAFNAGNHDDTAIVRIGPVLTYTDPVSIDVAPENVGHPALGGKTGTVNWTNVGLALQGLGTGHSGGKVLARVADPTNPSVTHPALYVIDEGEPLLGGFSWDPEGDRYVVGGDLNFMDVQPRQLNIPVNLAGRSNVQLTVALAGTDADFETGAEAHGLADDYFGIYFDPDGSGNFTLLSEFTGNAAKSLEEIQVENGARVLDENLAPIFTGFVLSNQFFKDYTVDLPVGTANAVVRFESNTTFPNEIVALDDVRIAEAAAPLTGDFNGNGAVDAADYVLWRNGGPLQNDPTPGVVDQSDYDLWRANFGRTSGSGSALGAGNVPEPAAAALVCIATCGFMIRRNRC
jgi:hypothetical protein